jgi:hypothetical protein
MKSFFIFIFLLVLSIGFAVAMDLLLGYSISQCLQNLNNPFWLMDNIELSTSLIIISLLFLKPLIVFVKKKFH